MRPRLQLHEMTAEEQAHVEQLAQSRTAAARLVERAKVIRLAGQGRTVTEIA
jgi:hypothetical protein